MQIAVCDDEKVYLDCLSRKIKACFKELEIEISLSNTIEKSVLSENHSLKTSKSRLQGHGYGIKTIKQIAEKYNGSADFYEKDNMFVCCVMLYRDF